MLLPDGDLPASTAPARTESTPWWIRLFRFRELALLLVIVLASLAVAQFTPYYLTLSNIRAMVIGMVPLGIIVAGQVVVLVSGGLDLSVGAVMALSGTLVGLLMLKGWPPAAAVAAMLVLGAAIGAANGWLITKLRVNALIATLGTMTIARSISLVFTEGFSVTNLPRAFSWAGQASLAGVPPMVWLMLLVVLALDLAMRWTRYFRLVYYVGGNERAALLSGIRVHRVQLFTYMLSGMLSALAGVLLASRLMAGTPTAGAGLELTVIAAAVIGGASLMGGEGTVFGAFLGVLLLTIVSNASIILGVSIYWQGVVTGLILVLVVALDMLIRRRT